MYVQVIRIHGLLSGIELVRAHIDETATKITGGA